MKGNEKILEKLNDILSDELTAVNQYMVHAEMSEDWGYGRLAEVVEKRAIMEMKHAEPIIARILFLEGIPVVSTLNPMHIGDNVEKQLKNDLAEELEAIKVYSESITLCAQKGDYGTQELLKSILSDEEGHLDWIEEQLDQISQMSIQVYLSTKG